LPTIRSSPGWFARSSQKIAEAAASVFIGTGRAGPFGQVERLILEKSRVSYAVLSFVGFRLIGDDYYPLPWQKLDYDERALEASASTSRRNKSKARRAMPASRISTGVPRVAAALTMPRRPALFGVARSVWLSRPAQAVPIGAMRTIRRDR
jgi:hypothetical protein